MSTGRSCETSERAVQRARGASGLSPALPGYGPLVSELRSGDSPPTADHRSRKGIGYLRALGPGLVTGASDDDPSGIGTYAQAGAEFRYGLLWTSLFTLPLMSAVQEICDRTALATGQTLSELAVARFPRWRHGLSLLVGLLFAANLLNITADIVAVGEGMHLLHAGPASLWAVLAGIAVTGLLIAGSFETIARMFKALCLALLSYLVVVFAAGPSWPDVLSHAVAPRIEFTKDYMLLVVAVLGTTISPYLFFWQNAHRIEELRDEPEGGDDPIPLGDRSPRAARRKMRTSRADVFTGMAFSNIVMFAIIVSTGATLGAGRHTTITSAAQAAEALRPIAGGLSETLFALGFIGSGMLAIPVLAGAGSVGIAGLVHKDWGFSRSFRDAPVFYGMVIVGTIGGTLLTLLGVDPIKLLVYSALINGLLAAPFLALIMVLSNDEQTMGEYRNGRVAQLLGWTATILMALAAGAYLVLR
jgi:NRAMP (natural resistance-associated macrophage protein)-like metal ion transporter